ncbi:hypothetical protein D9757_007238 [Collybiopsis confluens]|uniref:F-box domain-containing protein n=1 Tax=Collybiopsis confluens TaxID=2823264 RepID=A0A8H5HB34_9AGAR|nr:hypothetical protein D9757_007238 [Collybiopsis confluens]
MAKRRRKNRKQIGTADPRINLLDVPEELLSIICEMVPFDSLISFALSSRVFNRLAGTRYLRLIDYQYTSLSIASPRDRYFHGVPFGALYDVVRILGSLSQVSYISVRFSDSASTAFLQLESIVALLRQFQHDLSSIRLSFSGTRNGMPHAPSAFEKSFRDFMLQLQRLRCRSIDICGFVPVDEGFKFALPPNHLFGHMTISDCFLLAEQHRAWLIEFLNSSGISTLFMEFTEAWVQILPKLLMPSLRDFRFIGASRDSPNSDINVLTGFLARHPHVSIVHCGPRFRPMRRHRRGHSHPPLPSITHLIGTASQLSCLLKRPDVLRNLRIVRIESERPSTTRPFFQQPDPFPSSKHRLWELFSRLRGRSALQHLTLSMNTPEFRTDVLSRRRFTRRSELPQVGSLTVLDFETLTEHESRDFLKWGRKIFLGVTAVEVSFLKEWGDDGKISFARAVAEEWPDVLNLTINYSTKAVETWIQTKGG